MSLHDLENTVDLMTHIHISEAIKIFLRATILGMNKVSRPTSSSFINIHPFSL